MQGLVRGREVGVLVSYRVCMLRQDCGKRLLGIAERTT